MSDSPLILSLFSGAGGMDVAAHGLGFRTIGLELEKSLARITSAAGHDVYLADVREITAEPGRFTGLQGGPPCQTFSLTGTGEGRQHIEMICALAHLGGLDDLQEFALETPASYGLVLEPLRFALEAYEAGSPFEFVALEQVPPVLPIWEATAKRFASLGYGTDVGVLKAEQFGVPSTRRRAVMVARLRDPESVRLPKPIHRAYSKGTSWNGAGLLPWVSMAEVLDLDEDIAAMRSNYGTGGDSRNRGRRLVTEPAPTITSKIDRNRWVTADGDDVRGVSVEEAAALQSFQVGYPWYATPRRGDRLLGIGNACPPLLWRAVLEELIYDLANV